MPCCLLAHERFRIEFTDERKGTAIVRRIAGGDRQTSGDMAQWRIVADPEAQALVRRRESRRPKRCAGVQTQVREDLVDGGLLQDGGSCNAPP